VSEATDEVLKVIKRIEGAGKQNSLAPLASSGS